MHRPGDPPARSQEAAGLKNGSCWQVLSRLKAIRALGKPGYEVAVCEQATITARSAYASAKNEREPTEFEVDVWARKDLIHSVMPSVEQALECLGGWTCAVSRQCGCWGRRGLRLRAPPYSTWLWANRTSNDCPLFPFHRGTAEACR